MIKPEDIFKATRGGLDIILYYYPQAQNAVLKKEPFKKRDKEHTPSAHIKEYKGIWKVTDFGDDGVAKNAIDITMDEEGLSFAEALYKLADRYAIDSQLKSDLNKPVFENRAATEEEPEGHFVFECNEKMTEFELSVIGPRVKDEHVKKYNYHSLKSYSTTKDRKTITIKSTEHYPIFLRDCTWMDGKEKKNFYKIYQPLSFDKSRRFFYKNTKPPEYINGLAELERAYREYANQQEKEFRSDPKNEEKHFEAKKLDEAIICSGERDSLCCAALGYYPLWFNSETYRLSEEEHRTIMKYVERLYNIPDLDATGIKKGVELAMKFMDVYTIWLPDWLSTYKDMRGRPRKDLRDYVELRPKIQDFKNIVKIAMPMRFWEVKFTKEGVRQEINTEYVYHFLRLNGFGTMENKNSKTGQMFIHSQNNIVKEVKAKHVRGFLREFLETRYIDLEIRNLVNNTTRLSESSLDNLKEQKMDFSDYDRNRQFFFFENKTFEVTAAEIKEHKPLDVDRFVWDDEVIKHKIKRTSESFKITGVEGDFDITVKNTDSNFFSFLINASRVHWRKEYEERIAEFPEGKEAYMKANKFNIAGPLLNETEVEEQKLHLINKIFTIGYLLHRYKDPHRAWCVFAMDNVIGEAGDSNGRSGKSFCYKALRKFMKSVTLSGRNPKLTENPHIYDRISEYTDLVIVDDSHEYLDFNFFFDVVTGDMPVNPKNNQSYEIPFEKAPKFCITSNYTIRKIDPSTIGRILYSVFSDYYHQKTENNSYLETRSIFDDFGKNLMMDDYNYDDWNNDYNFLAECCQYYLATISIDNFGKLQPPMGNVTSRNLLTQMGEQFENWALVYFSPESDNINRLVSKEDALTDFINTAKVKNWTTQRFTKALNAFWGRNRSYILRIDPDEYKNSGGRIVRKINGKATEMIYVQTTEEIDLSEITNASDGNKPF